MPSFCPLSLIYDFEHTTALAVSVHYLHLQLVK